MYVLVVNARVTAQLVSEGGLVGMLAGFILATTQYSLSTAVCM